MGWNQGYTIFEATVIGAYNEGILDKKLLSVLMEPYRDTDIDSGGSRDLVSTDGKCVRQIVVETWGLVWPVLPDNPTEDEEDECWETRYNLFDKIASVEFGWG